MGYSNERKAEAIVTAAFTNDQEAARICDVSARSIQRWRRQMDEDPEMSKNVALKWNEYRQDNNWIEDATRTVQKAMAFLRRATEELDPSKPRHVEAVTNAIRTLAEAKLAADVIDARLKDVRNSEQGGRDRTEGRQDVAGYIGRGGP